MGDETVTCPYDRAHCVIRSRLQTHLTKCRVNYPNMEKEICPFNSTHVINKPEMKFHMETCGNRGILENFICEVGASAAPIGLMPVKTFDIHQNTGCDEDWDTVTPGASVLDHVKEAAEKKPVLIGLTGASKAVRRDYKFQQRRRYQALAEGHVPEQVSQPPGSIPNQKQPPNAKPNKVEQSGSSLSGQLNNLAITDEAPKPNAWGKPPVVKQDAEPSTPCFISQPAPANRAPAASSAARSSSNPWNKTDSTQGPNHYVTSSAPLTSGPTGLTSKPGMGVWGRGNVIGGAQYSVNSDDFPTLLPVSCRGRKIQPE